jgi:hypothetical protein
MKNMQRVKDLTGQKFGRLEVIGIDDNGDRKTNWICQCDCGAIKSVRSDSLQNGAVKSCGCLKKEQDRQNLTKHHSHKQSGTRLYQIWVGLKGRCQNENNARYSNYGGRGISVCEEWNKSFQAFYDWSLENGYDETLTIDRIDNDGNYAPANCRWATIEEQCNNRRTNVVIKIGNAEKTLTQWCDIFEVDYKTIYARYHRNEYSTIHDLFNPR